MSYLRHSFGRAGALLLAVLSVTGIVALAQSQAPESGATAPKTTYLRCANLWDGRSDRIQRDVVVAIDGARISAVGAAVPAQAGVVIDLPAQTCLPGLIDVHTHILELSAKDIQDGAEKESVAARTIRGVAIARRALEYGFTSIRDLNDMGVHAADVEISRAIARGVIPGPRMQVATTGLSSSAMATPEVAVCDGVEGCRRAVRETVARGANWIKVFADRGVRRQEAIFDDQPTFTLEELRAIVDEAHRQGRRVAAHASGKSSVHLAVSAGVDSIEHGMYIAPEDVDAMLTGGIWYVPTLYLMTKAVFSSPEQEAKSQAGINIIIDTFQRAQRAGVKIAFGSDIGAFDWSVSPAVQLPLMVQYGWTPFKALRSATMSAAELLGMSKDIGSIEKGKAADIIAVDGDPLSDLNTLKNVRFVMKAGAVVKRP